MRLGVIAALAASGCIGAGLVAAQAVGPATGGEARAKAPPAARATAVQWGVTKAPAGHRIHPHLPKWPAAGILIDLNTGEVMWSYRADARRPIASLTKLMNALVVTDRPRLDHRVRISSQAANMGGSVVGGYAVGSRVLVSDLLKGMLIVSGNDAAVALAQGVGHGRFVAAMNRKARQLRLKCTRYATPEGLDDRDRSCARDLALMGRLVIAQPALRRIVRTVWTRVPVGGGRTRGLWNRNPLMRSHYYGITGIKTGHTNSAGWCLVASARRGSRRLLAVMLAEDEHGSSAAALLDQGFRALRR